jgi:C_GCAxxG_C_C family probable redox protein
VRAVGAPVLGETYDEKLFRAAAGFGGGVGGTHEHICGAITGGVIVMSMLYARTDPAVKDEVLYAHIKKYIERFNAEIGGTICKKLRDEGPYGEKGPLSCQILVERAAPILIECLE